MGSRGAFLSVEANDFSFIDGGQHYKSIGVLSNNQNVKVLVQNSRNVKAPEYSHTQERVYAIVKDGVLKHLAFYDSDHRQSACVDFCHAHKGIQPHRHEYLNHGKNALGVYPTDSELSLAKQIRKEFHLK